MLLNHFICFTVFLLTTSAACATESSCYGVGRTDRHYLGGGGLAPQKVSTGIDRWIAGTLHHVFVSLCTQNRCTMKVAMVAMDMCPQGLSLRTTIPSPATQTLNLQEVVDLSAIPHISPSLGLEPGHARRDLALSRSSAKRRPPIWKHPKSDEAERLGQSLSHREALASYLVSLLLQPTSPPDSDVEEEEERQKPL